MCEDGGMIVKGLNLVGMHMEFVNVIECLGV
jgi:hypothetical protein